MNGNFLTAKWRYLAMLNFPIEPEILVPHVPEGTELDFWNGKTYVSVVGFLFLNTKVMGFPIPFHRDFEEVNLRFYVKRYAPQEVRRGVCFIKEIVPKPAIAAVARYCYNENYVSTSMAHEIEIGASISASYLWTHQGSDYSIDLLTNGPALAPIPGSEEEFIAEHYWGYSRQRDSSTIEYEVRHPPWNVWQTESASIKGDYAKLYGQEFANTLAKEPSSAFLADGSDISVSKGSKLLEQ